MDADNERHNHDEIERLNQRGGRTLSIVDLIHAGTIGVEMAAYAARAMVEGASILTGAQPGGAGKTTLMAAVLNFLPPDVPIITVDQPKVVADALARGADEPACCLVHEIGSGDWFGYLWGPPVADFISLVGGRRRIASCLHADTLDELTETLSSPPLGVRPECLGRVGLILFMHVDTFGGTYRRRVSTFYEADGRGAHRLLYQWRADSDEFDRVGPLRDPTGLTRYVDFINRLVEAPEVDTQSVRRKVVDFHKNAT